MQSLTLKRVQKFDISQPISLSDDNNVLGTIAPDSL